MANTINGGSNINKAIASFIEIIAMNAMPPTNKTNCLIISAIVVVKVSWICERSAEIRLLSSPTLRFEKKFIGRVISLK